MKTNIKSGVANWFLNVPNDYEKWMQKYDKTTENPYKYWGDYYDGSIQPYLDKMKKWR